MLAACAPGYVPKSDKKNETWRVMFNGKTGRLPTGDHGRRDNPETFIGHVRQMVRNLGIEECASKHIDGIKPPKKDSETAKAKPVAEAD